MKKPDNIYRQQPSRCRRKIKRMQTNS